MSKRIQRPEKHILEELYAKEGTTISSLARQFSTTAPTARRWLREYGIERKSHWQACKEANNRKQNSVKPTKKELSDLYEENSIKNLELYYGVSQETVYSWLKEYNIQLRTLSESTKKFISKKYEHINFSKEYIEENYKDVDTVLELADKLEVSRSHILKLFKIYDIEKKPVENIKRSKAEIELYNFLVENFPDDKWVHNNQTLIFPLELDIINVSQKIAIEYCGIYWHSEGSSGKAPNYHKIKYDLCKDLGYKLITIFETDDIEKVKCYLLKLLGKSRRIFARKTVIKSITPTQASEFHNKHHLHNSIGAKYHYGLFYEGEMVMVGSFGVNRFSKKYEYECSRLTSASNITVVGGVSKIFKHFIRSETPNSIVTFADLRFGDGSSYLNCGFKYLGNTAPNYWYYKKNTNKLFSRVKFQKHKLSEQLEFFDPDKTEFENMLDNKWDRIWDCGNAKYEYRKGGE